jgi:hypothetical protein
METRIQPGAMAGFGCLIRVKMTRSAGDPVGSGHITAQIFTFRDNPLKYTDPDGNEITRIPLPQQPNTMPRINIPYASQSAYQGILNRHENIKAISDAFEHFGYDNTGNAIVATKALWKTIDKYFGNKKYLEAATKFQFKVMIAFAEAKVKAKTSGEFDFNSDGIYSDHEVSAFTDRVNNEMGFNFTDQSSLGPYAGEVDIPRLSEDSANSYLNFKQPFENNTGD